MDAFLPDTYEPPKSTSGYMKLQDGKNKFRILSSPILGWEYWTQKDGKKMPVRLAYTEDNYRVAQREAQKNIDEKDKKAKHFWAMTVWNYNTNAIEILELVQAKMQKSIRDTSKEPEWGNPVNRYDFVITKSGRDMSTEYSMTAIPPSTTAPEITKAIKEKPINLNALFSGGNPFEEAVVDEELVKDIYN
jgi:hypothetical protein